MISCNHIVPGGGTTATPLNLRKRVALLQRSVPLAGKRILDCGCGPGDYLIDLLGSGYDATGIEFDKKSVVEFQQKYPKYQDRIHQGDLEAIDLALFNEVLEHVPHDAKAVGEAFRVLKPGGIIAIFSPNRLYPFESHGVRLKATNKPLSIYTPFVPYVPRVIGEKVFSYWARDYWPAELQRIVTANGFKIIYTDFVWQTFENNSTQQPTAIANARSTLRTISSRLERTPILRMFGISQFIVGMKPGGTTK